MTAQPTPFDCLRVIELAGSVAGAYCAKLFADAGADVLRIEAPDDWPGLDAHRPHASRYVDTSKHIAAWEPFSPAGDGRLRELLRRADVLVESLPPARSAALRLRFADLAPQNPGLVVVSLTPFGLSGPYRDYRLTPFLAFAAGGQMYLNGDPDREPIAPSGLQAEYQHGSHGFLAALAALYARDECGGQQVDVSMFETMASLHEWTLVRYTHGGVVQRRAGNRYTTVYPIAIYPCSDGWVAVTVVNNDQWERLCLAIERPELPEDPRYATPALRSENAETLKAEILPWFAAHGRFAVHELLQTYRVPVAAVQNLPNVIAEDHYRERGFWRETPGGLDGRVVLPGPPYRLSEHAWRQSPAVRVTPEEASARWPAPRKARRGAARGASGRGPLAGLRVLDLSMAWAGPLTARLLGDLGADVVKVEAPWARGGREVTRETVLVSGRYPDNEAGERPYNREASFNNRNWNKRAIALRLDDPRGKDVLTRLIRWADVLVENFSPRVLPNLGFPREALLELNPRLVAVSMPGFGLSGPRTNDISYGTTLEPATGHSFTLGYPDSGPYLSGVAWPDAMAALYAASASLIALHDRRITGRGQLIEVAQAEGLFTYLGDAFAAYGVMGEVPAPRGNAHPAFAPHGCYRCLGDDRWLAVAITSDAQWVSFAAAIGRPELARDPRFASAAERRRYAAEADRVVADWAAGQDHVAAMHLLQHAGVPAAAVLDARELVEDPHLQERGFMVTVEHPDAGRLRLPGIPLRMSATPVSLRMPAPCLGQHNREILCNVLGLSEEEYRGLLAAGVVASEPPAGERAQPTTGLPVAHPAPAEAPATRGKARSNQAGAAP